MRSTLDKKQSMSPYEDCSLPPNLVFDIAEDRCIDVDGILPAARPVDPQAVALLYIPLPADLPTVDKDLLILMAAWTGNVDRYSRLRRPKRTTEELVCIIRGIHHHPLFARWWLTQLDEDTAGNLRQAVYARCVMNNDLSWLTDSVPDRTYS